MTGRAEVKSMQQRLDATFRRIDEAGLESEVQSDFARYLCVLVSGYLEKAVYELVLEHARKNGTLSLQRFVDHRTKRFTNASSGKIKDLLGEFNPEWGEQIETYIDGEIRDGINAVVDLRNNIAHGGSVGVTYRTISDYYTRVKKAVGYIADLCVPL
jgi:hypothetical protein